jgi:hypothetical protein
MSNAAAASVNVACFWLLLAVLGLGTAALLVIPYVGEARARHADWPRSLGTEVPSIKFYPLANFVNVFPPWQQGTKNPVALAPKFPEPTASGTKELSA